MALALSIWHHLTSLMLSGPSESLYESLSKEDTQVQIPALVDNINNITVNAKIKQFFIQLAFFPSVTASWTGFRKHT